MRWSSNSEKIAKAATELSVAQAEVRTGALLTLGILAGRSRGAAEAVAVHAAAVAACLHDDSVEVRHAALNALDQLVRSGQSWIVARHRDVVAEAAAGDAELLVQGMAERLLARLRASAREPGTTRGLEREPPGNRGSAEIGASGERLAALDDDQAALLRMGDQLTKALAAQTELQLASRGPQLAELQFSKALAELQGLVTKPSTATVGQGDIEFWY